MSPCGAPRKVRSLRQRNLRHSPGFMATIRLCRPPSGFLSHLEGRGSQLEKAALQGALPWGVKPWGGSGWLFTPHASACCCSYLVR